jgi:hypothetical protein
LSRKRRKLSFTPIVVGKTLVFLKGLLIIPCFIRRIAIESYCPDQTAYARDVFSDNFNGLPPDDEGRRNLADLAEFTIKFETLSNSQLYEEWPELFSENIDAPSTILMYKRAAIETRAVLSKYPVAAQVLT